MSKYFGPHLMLDFPVDSDKLCDIPFWEDLLEELVETVKMTPLSRPTVVYSECDNAAWDPPHATGVSGYIVLAESHISFHTFHESQFVFLDIFSCKPFDYNDVFDVLEKKLGAHDYHTNVVHRGKNFPGCAPKETTYGEFKRKAMTGQR